MLTRRELEALSKPELVDLCLTLQATIQRLEAVVAQQEATIARLEARVSELEQRLNQNSRNSHRPPSSEGYRKPTSLTRREQEAAGRPAGGQPGHEGSHLAMVAEPDHIEVMWPEQCPKCGTELGGVGQLAARAQVHELPKTRLQVTEWQVLEGSCPKCGLACRGQLPAGVRPGAQYGPRLKAAMVYLSVEHLLPWQRTTRLLSDLVGAGAGEGCLSQALERCAAGVKPVVKEIRAALASRDVAHFDETGARVAGRLMWLHTASNAELTYYHVHSHRGRKAHDEIGILPAFRGRACHDAYASYFGYACDHALCNAHLLRELTAVAEATDQTWASDLAELLRAIYHRRKEVGALPDEVQVAYRRQYDQLVQVGRLAHPIDLSEFLAAGTGRIKRSPAQRLLLRLAEHADDYLRFMTDPRIPFDNNQAERDLRMVKVQQKVSGCFRTVDGAEAFCLLRSYISTVRKQGGDVLEALKSVFDGQPILPQLLAPAE
jgi:transposase